MIAGSILYVNLAVRMCCLSFLLATDVGTKRGTGMGSTKALGLRIVQGTHPAVLLDISKFHSSKVTTFKKMQHSKKTENPGHYLCS